MQKRRHSQKHASVLLLITLLLSVLVALIPPLISKPISVGAGQNIAVTGFGSQDATITDTTGKDFTHAPNLSMYSVYTLTYHWRIPDEVVVKAGDTATVSLPATVVSRADVDFAVVDPTTGATIGHFFSKAGSSTGILTFTDFFSHSTVGRQGELQFMVSGRYDDSGHQRPGWYIYKAGWVVNPPTGATPEEKAQYVDDLGRPKIFQWEITINPNMEHVDNVVLTDTLGPGQHFDTSRGLVVHTGTYDDNWFHATGTITPSYQVNGNQVKISLGTITTAIQIDLWTNPTSASFETTDSWTNSVVASGKQGGTGAPAQANGTITWRNGGSGTGQVGQVTLIKQDQKTHQQALAGAVFSLYRADGTLVHDDLTTDTKGKLTFTQLLVGQYYFVETKAPKGYKLNATHLPFTITLDKPQVTVKAYDENLTPPPVTPSTPSSESSSSMTPPSKPSSASSSKPSVPSSSVTPPSKPSTPSSSVTPPSKPSTPSSSVTPPSKPSTPSSSVTPPSKPSSPSSSVTPPSKPSTPSSSVTPPSKPSSPSSSVTPPSKPSSSSSEPSKPAASSTPSHQESSSSVSSSDVIPSSSSESDSSANVEVVTPSHNNTHHLPDTGERVLGWLAIAIGSLLSITGILLLIKDYQ
ncbi:SpaA isopeptide-forming pilin-related protein [Lacticaseibacillus paracasei]|uniref:SpaA isopeptide-forming pilin-related protein n=1 Tax=Lacticaseibacillus paracasei TaxID=1597 RepID=UPI002ADEEAE5|nr:SpaA isopeptide-forming pilin-related protein [Lacticaseibacillus paracasei]MEA0973987.1 SpaA isopeptide-forming pilin-related protein [Lacticaseibacillus paracasei]